ncbi:MAG: hypothetical protein QW474_03690 [Candidatus Aenigmatarchaeota archaeon]
MTSKKTQSDKYSHILEDLRKLAAKHGVELNEVADLYSRDLGDLERLLFENYRTFSEKGIREIIMAAIVLGHSGLLERGYEFLNAFKLVKKGLGDPSSILYSLGIASVRGKKDDFYRKREYKPKQPDNDELILALTFAVGLRGYSIDDPNTSVGELYQKLYGTDFRNMRFDVGGKSTPYTLIPEEIKDSVNEDILKQKGYNPLSDTTRDSLLRQLKRNDTWNET